MSQSRVFNSLKRTTKPELTLSSPRGNHEEVENLIKIIRVSSPQISTPNPILSMQSLPQIIGRQIRNNMELLLYLQTLGRPTVVQQAI